MVYQHLKKRCPEYSFVSQFPVSGDPSCCSFSQGVYLKIFLGSLITPLLPDLGVSLENRLPSQNSTGGYLPPIYSTIRGPRVPPSCLSPSPLVSCG